jgi:hypothetical protein
MQYKNLILMAINLLHIYIYIYIYILELQKLNFDYLKFG